MCVGLFSVLSLLLFWIFFTLRRAWVMSERGKRVRVRGWGKRVRVRGGGKE